MNSLATGTNSEATIKNRILISKLFLLILLLTILAGCSTKSAEVLSTPQKSKETTEHKKVARKVAKANWKTTQVSRAITWKYNHFDNLFSSNQSVTVIDVNLHDNHTINVTYSPSGLWKTSEAAKKANAITAINGSYFSFSSGKSVTFFKKDGEIIVDTAKDDNRFMENSGFAISKSNEISIVKRPGKKGWGTTEAKTLLTSGPLLVYNGKIVNLSQNDFNTTRNPRTAVCVTQNNHLIATVVDGRDKEASGMTTMELAIVMKDLGCEDAMNLDGGGSSTAWVKNYGVVNFPSDNDRFDHKGGRSVATVITFGKAVK